tara:strand:- start:64455 stop:66074 length:1620 start_codon:yes stop_codon:yes gene_type:complete
MRRHPINLSLKFILSTLAMSASLAYCQQSFACDTPECQTTQHNSNANTQFNSFEVPELTYEAPEQTLELETDMNSFLQDSISDNANIQYNANPQNSGSQPAIGVTTDMNGFVGDSISNGANVQYKSKLGGNTQTPQQQQAGDECANQRNLTEKWCDIENDGFTMMAQMMIGSMGSTISESCDGAKNVTFMTSGLSSTLSAKCQYHISSCKTACEPLGTQQLDKVDGADKTAADYLRFCQAQTMNYMKLTASAAQALQAHYAAKDCELTTKMQEELTACTSADTMSDPTQCPSVACDFNTYPQNQGHPSCPTSVANSGDYTQCAGANAQYNPACAPCFSAAPPASCPADLGSGYGGNEFNDALNGDQYDYDGLGNALTDDDFFNSDFNGFDGETAAQASLATGGNVGNAGGLGSASGGGGGGPGGGAPGGADSGIDTDILGRLSGSGGGGGGGGFSGGYATGAGNAWKKNGRGIGSATQKDKFDLSKLLKDLGGKNSGRTTASLSADQKLSQAGITKANGLSNFQKVTRMINKKRVSLDK